MNAPATPDSVMEQIVAEHLPIAAIRASQSAAQALRRKRYDQEQLLALAANIQQVGVMQPILVRPLRPPRDAQYEIVAGERRWLAADRAGLAHIPAIIRELADAEAITLQLTENIQRESIHPLEEAEGFHELMQARNLKAEQLGDLLGKSRSYVYARLKLRDLCPDARDALQAGTLDASKALLLARLPGAKVQKQALRYIDNVPHYSYRTLLDSLRTRFMADLSNPPFDMADPARARTVGAKTYAWDCGACTDCPHNSDNDPEIRDTLPDGARVCTNRSCFDLKTEAHYAKLRADLEAKGKKVITGDEAKRIIPGQWGIADGYVDPNDTVEDWGDDDGDQDEEAPAKRYRDLLGKAKIEPVLVEDPRTGQIRELLRAADVRDALEKKGVAVPDWALREPQEQQKLDLDPEKEKAERAKAELARTIELTYRKRLLLAIHAKWKGPLKRTDLERIIVELCDRLWDEQRDLIDELCGGEIKLDRMKEEDLVRLMVECTLVSDALHTNGKPGDLLELAQRFKIDAKKIRADVTAELKPKPAKVDTPQPKVAAKPAKKKAAKK